jgi:unsaturated chondroitin disaccharide hydrolase
MPASRASNTPLGVALLVIALALPCCASRGDPSSDYGPPQSACSSAARHPSILETAHDIYLPLAQNLSPLDGYPRSIVEGSEWDQRQPYEWTSGFFAGILWQLYGIFPDEDLLEQGQRWTEGLEGQTNAPTHDVGFMINNSFGRGYRAAGIEEYRAVTLEAAEHLATRFDPDVGAIRAWGAMGRYSYPVIIDGMMNLEILFWAARNGGEAYLADVARTHAMTTIRDFLRSDGTTFHLVDYDPDTGDVLRRGTVQGYSDTSTWARGQAWALYGFTIAYKETSEPLFLETACRTADAFLERLPEDLIPCWDFDAAEIPGEPKDSSAAAIAASGLWDLASLVEDPADMQRYSEASLALVARLSSDEYSAYDLGLPALLLHATGNRPANREVDVPLIYADYYYIEALIKQLTPCSAPDDTSFRTSDVRSYPNPFRAGTRLTYSLPAAAAVTIRIYDASGRLVRSLLEDGRQADGVNIVSWDGRDNAGRVLPSGVYLCRIDVCGETLTCKTALLR